MYPKVHNDYQRKNVVENPNIQKIEYLYQKNAVENPSIQKI